MKDILTGCIVAFSMYSKIPMPQIDWTDKNMKYAICYFPLIGAIEGALVYLWYLLAMQLHINGSLRAAVMMSLPVIINGGIHLDGFLDTQDALSSWKTREQRLEILKDSHCGAFAIISALVYGVLTFGVNAQADEKDLRVLIFVFVLVRAWSGLALVRFRKAKNSGLLRTFADAAMSGVVAKVMIVYIVLCCGAMVLLDPVRGGIGAMLSILVFFYYREMSYKTFGGITGDLAGWFVQVCECIVWMGVTIL